MRVPLVQAFQSPPFPVGDGANVNKTLKTTGLKDKGALLHPKLHKPTVSMEETDLMEISLQAYSVEFIFFSSY